MSTLYFDDYFVSENDPGIEVRINIDGQEIPVFIKKRLTLDDIEAAKEIGVKKTINFQTGDVTVDKLDESAFTLELMVRTVVSWPFKYRDGKNVPINKKTLRSMDSRLYQEISKIVQEQFNKRKEAVAPLERDSAEV